MFRRLAVVALLAAACADPRPPDVVLITVDTLRADHLTPYGYARDTTPFLQRLASESVVFEDVVAQCGTTPQSLASLMTGLFPYTDGIVTQNGPFVFLRPEATTLAARLSAAGYRTHAITSSIQSAEVTGVSLGFETFDGVDVSSEVKRSRRRDAATVTDRALAWLAEPREAPVFVWLHYLDPHHPYAPPEDYAALWDEDVPAGETRTYRFDERRSDAYPLSDGELAGLVADYDREIRALDDALARLFAEAALDDAVVVLTADHGEALGEHGMITHNDLYRSIVRVPLLLRAPGLPAGERVDAPVMLVDVAPTVLELAGLPAPADLRGRSLLATLRGERARDRVRLSEYPTQRAVSAGGFKLIDRGDRVELYDLAADPSETHDLAGTREQVETALRVEIAAFAARRLFDPSGGDVARPEVDPAMVEELRALGY